MPEHFRMNEATGQELNPARLLAYGAPMTCADLALDIQLEARFDKGEITWPQPNGHLTLEDRAEQGLHTVDEIRDADLLLDHQAFHLVESMFMRRIGSFKTKDFSWKNRPEWRCVGLHRTNLTGRGMRAEQVAAL